VIIRGHTMKRKSKRRKRKVLFVILIIGYLIPQNLKMPVDGADQNDYNPESFWYYPWGKSIVHHGVDIFASDGTTIRPATAGVVIFKGNFGIGGNTVVVLGPKWRWHYYAHLKEINTHWLAPVGKVSDIGTVGTSGNAAGKPPHLHYSIFTPIPYPWRWDGDRLGWQKMFFLNPIDYLNEN